MVDEFLRNYGEERFFEWDLLTVFPQEHEGHTLVQYLVLLALDCYKQ